MNYEALKDMIKRHEAGSSPRLRKYPCSRGHWTIGWGWNMDAWSLPPEIAAYYRMKGEITREMAELLLDISLDTAIHQCREIYPGFDGFSEVRQMALIDFVFNLGAFGALGFKRMRRAIIAGDWAEAALQVNDSLYWRQLGGDPAGIDDGKLERPEEIAGMLREG